MGRAMRLVEAGVLLLFVFWFLGRRRNVATAAATAAAIAELRAQVSVLTQVSNQTSITIGGSGVYDDSPLRSAVGRSDELVGVPVDCLGPSERGEVCQGRVQGGGLILPEGVCSDDA